jgi:hypothetical protein
VVPVPKLDLEEAKSTVLKHLRKYGTMTEAEITRLVGGARGYRRLRRAFDCDELMVVLEPTPRGAIWRIGEAR